MWLTLTFAASPIVIKAQQLTYNIDTQTLNIKGKALIDYKGYTLSGTDWHTDHTFSHAYGKNLTLYHKNTPYFSAHYVHKENDNSTFHQSSFSTCNNCGTQRLWSLYTQKLTHNNQQQRIYHRSALLKIGKLPILWVPYLSHPDFQARYQRGFLSPYIDISKDGVTMGVPYYIPGNDTLDMTVTPFITKKYGWALATVARKRFQNGFSKIDGAVSASSSKPLQGHGFFENYYDITQRTRLKFDIKRVSSTDYIQRFWWLHRKGFLHYEPLVSQASMDHAYDQGAVLFRNYTIQYDEKKQPIIPHWTWSHDIIQKSIALRLHHRIFGKNHFSHGIAFEKHMLLKGGVQVYAHAQERLNYYDMKTWRFMPKGVFKVAWPLWHAQKRWLLTPIGQITLARPSLDENMPCHNSYDTLITQSFLTEEPTKMRINLGGTLSTPDSFSEWFLDIKHRQSEKMSWSAFSRGWANLGHNLRYTCQFAWSYDCAQCRYLESGITYTAGKHQLYGGFIHKPGEDSTLHINGSVGVSDHITMHGGYIGNIDKNIAYYGAINFDNECLSWDVGIIRRAAYEKKSGEKINDIGVLLRLNFKIQKDEKSPLPTRLPITPLQN